MEINNSSLNGIYSIAYSPTKHTAAKSSSDSAKAAQREPESIWRKMVSQYNVRSITIEETARLSQELYNAGEISLGDHAILSLDPSRIPNGSGFLGQADSSGHRDLIAECEARIDMDKKTGNSQSVAHNEGFLDT